MRFPSELCSDSGLKINNADLAWTETLRGEAADLYVRYERELKPKGFGMAARVVDYPNGMPGDIALFLVWQNWTASQVLHSCCRMLLSGGGAAAC